jgi:integrase
MSGPKPPSVNLKRKVLLNGEWTFVPVAKKNGNYLPHHVLIRGVSTKVTEGTFYVEWRENRKRIQKAVGGNGHEAIAARETQIAIHKLRAAGVKVEQDAPAITVKKETLEESVTAYLKDNRTRLRPKTLLKYREALIGFVAFTRKSTVEDLRPDDIREFLAHMHEAGLAPKTAKVKGRIVHGVFSGLGAILTMKRGDWPKVTKKTTRAMYKVAAVKQLLSTVSREHYILWSFFLHTGFREQEVSFCSWPDVDWEQGMISVTEKLERGFRPKNYEQRTIPVVTELMYLLREHRKTLPDDAFFLFPTQPAKGIGGIQKNGGKNRLNLLDLLKADYLHAGLNCGQCQVTRKGKPTTCAGIPQCQKCGLHMFRHTFATNHLRDGRTLTDVSKLLGHQDAATTQIYLHSLESEDMREQILQGGLGQMYVPDEFKPVEVRRIHIVSEDARKRMSEGGKKSAQAKVTPMTVTA